MFRFSRFSSLAGAARRRAPEKPANFSTKQEKSENLENLSKPSQTQAHNDSSPSSSSSPTFFPSFPPLPNGRPNPRHPIFNQENKSSIKQWNSNMKTFHSNQLSSSQLYQLLSNLIIPRPIAWISTRNLSGQGNLAPYSFFQLVSSKPPVLMISIAPNSKGGKKDTLRNIEETGEFVINSVHEWNSQQMNSTGKEWKYGENEIHIENLTEIPSQYVKPSRIGESSVQMECKLHGYYPIGSLNSPGSSTVVFGEILCIHLMDQLWNPKENTIHIDKWHGISRSAGNSYSRMRKDLEFDFSSSSSPTKEEKKEKNQKKREEEEEKEEKSHGIVKNSSSLSQFPPALGSNHPHHHQNKK